MPVGTYAQYSITHQLRPYECKDIKNVIMLQIYDEIFCNV